MKCTTSHSQLQTCGTIECTKDELNLDVVLQNGQSFRWTTRLRDHVQTFYGVAMNRYWKIWRTGESTVSFQVIARFSTCKDSTVEADAAALRKYFQLDCVSVKDLYTQWQSNDALFASFFNDQETRLQGVRILRQPLIETIFAFICSANNNILRISKMVESLATLYGEKISIMDDNNEQKEVFDFPTIAQFSQKLASMEATLRSKGFGYRAKYIASTVRTLSQHDDDFEQTLTNGSYADAKREMQKLDGVGPKVADCILLMALGRHHVVPVDTHVFNITATHYLPELQGLKTLSNAAYQQISDFYVERFGPFAGWAHSVLFSTRLKRFNQPKHQGNQSSDTIINQ